MGRSKYEFDSDNLEPGELIVELEYRLQPGSHPRRDNTRSLLKGSSQLSTLSRFLPRRPLLKHDKLIGLSTNIVTEKRILIDVATNMTSACENLNCHMLILLLLRNVKQGKSSPLLARNQGAPLSAGAFTNHVSQQTIHRLLLVVDIFDNLSRSCGETQIAPA